MDINKFIECLNSKNFDTETALSIIQEYCKIYNKDSNKISKLFSILIQNQFYNLVFGLLYHIYPINLYF